MSRVVLYTKPGCCLCDTVKDQLRSLRAAHPFELQEINLLEDSAAYAEYHEQIPVVLIDGRKAFKYHLDEGEFLRRLKSRSTDGEN